MASEDCLDAGIGIHDAAAAEEAIRRVAYPLFLHRVFFLTGAVRKRNVLAGCGV